jgi:glucose-1-phosphate adenylyltransferase
MLARQLPLKSVALILAGGRGTRLRFDKKRAKPRFTGGKFRIIDFALSNCINSGIRRIGVITQYQSHTGAAYSAWLVVLHEEMNLSICYLLSSVCMAKLVSRHRRCGHEPRHHSPLWCEYIVILAGDHIYKQDYSRMLMIMSKKVRVAPWPLPVPIEEASAFGVMAG